MKLVDIKTKMQSIDVKNTIAWTILIAVTAWSVWFMLYGQEIHSNEADAPTSLSRTIDAIKTFVLVGSLILPVTTKRRLSVNNSLIVVGGAYITYIAIAFLSLRKSSSEVSMEAKGAAIVFSCLSAWLIYKIFRISKVKKWL